MGKGQPMTTTQLQMRAYDQVLGWKRREGLVPSLTGSTEITIASPAIEEFPMMLKRLIGVMTFEITDCELIITFDSQRVHLQNLKVLSDLRAQTMSVKGNVLTISWRI